eukprot:jgi/Mesvir1/24293/Mv10989-RA.2
MKKTPSRPRPACSVNLFGQLDSIRATCERNMLGPNPTLARLDYPSSSSSGEDDDEDRYGGGDGDRCGGDVGEDQFGNRDKFGNYGEAEKDKYGADKDITYKRGGAGMRHKYGGLMYARGGGPEHAPAGGTLRASMGDGTGAIEDGGVDGDDSEDDISNELSKPPRKGGFASEAPASLSSAYSLKHSVASLKEAAHVRALLDKDSRMAESAAKRDADIVTLRQYEETKSRRRPNTAHPLSRPQPTASTASHAVTTAYKATPKMDLLSESARPAVASSHTSGHASSRGRTPRGDGRPLYGPNSAAAAPTLSTSSHPRRPPREKSGVPHARGVQVATQTPTGSNALALTGGARPLYRPGASMSQKTPR